MTKKHRTFSKIAPKQILDLLSSPHYTPQTQEEIARHLRLPGFAKESLQKTLHNLVAQGRIVALRDNRFAIAEQIGLVLGTLRTHESGFGFVVPDDTALADTFIPKHAISTAMHKDKVLVRLDDPASQRDPSKGPSGKIVRIVERANPTVVGTLAASKQFTYVIPDDPRLSQDIYVSTEYLHGAKVQDRVIVRITEWPSKHVSPEGRIEEVLGSSEDPKIDLVATLKKYHFTRDFPGAVCNEADAISLEIPAAALKGRRDLRKSTVFTIDPEDAKDFDDAVSLEPTKDGAILGVHIADVSYYVKEDSALDKEARGRGTSVYLPHCVVPMLPERLSNGVCSLKEAEDRLTKTVLFHCTPNAEIKKVEIFPSIIRSVKRFTYAQVLNIITTQHPVVDNDVRPLVPILKEMARWAKHFHQRRIARGSILLNIPKVKVVLDEQYRAIGIAREQQDEAHGLIEEFMLLANEAVARHISDHGRPGIYRIHEPPDRQSFEEFAVFVRSLGYRINSSDISVHSIQHLLEQIKGKPEEPIVHIHLLRSMKLAVYGNKCLGHFALALKFYTHFTSPIRRYPDLIVHRILDHMASKAAFLSAGQIGTMAAHSSRTERTADEAERELTKIKLLQFLSGLAASHSRRIYEGIVTAVKSFGFFVEMEESLIEGVVHLSSIRDDFYHADVQRGIVTGRRRHRRFKLGQRVAVRIEKVDMAKKQVDLILA